MTRGCCVPLYKQASVEMERYDISMAIFSLTGKKVLPMASTMLLLGLLMATLHVTGVQSIGVCYGNNGDTPPEKEVVDLYKSKNIGSMRIYYPNRAALEALRGSNIGLILDVAKEDLQKLTDTAAANSWVQTNVRSYWPDVKFRYIAVGNEITDENTRNILPAMQNVHNALVSMGLQEIKVSTAVATSVLGKSYPPNEGAFSSAAQEYLRPIVSFLVQNKAPLLHNIYPYFSHVGDPASVSLPYALFTSPSAPDGKYQNVFDAMMDAMYAALEKLGGSTVEIVVSESGWPSAGGKEATIENARTYNSKLIEHVKGGTPNRPGKAIETYIFAMFNENRKEPEVEKNFGLFYTDKRPVYPINFT